MVKDLHHANILIGQGSCQDLISNLLKESLDFDVNGNPDFFEIKSQTFGIDDARNLENWSSGKPLLGNVKAVFIEVESITFEAQNALLKVFEEPTPGTYFFVKLPGLAGLLPTFLSRMSIMNILNEKISESKEAIEFIKGDIKKRLKIISSVYSKEDRSKIKNLLTDLEVVSWGGRQPIHKIKQILIAKVLASARGSSPKMLLEWLSCVI